jgi:hypothetical protein
MSLRIYVEIRIYYSFCANKEQTTLDPRLRGDDARIEIKDWRNNLPPFACGGMNLG